MLIPFKWTLKVRDSLVEQGLDPATAPHLVICLPTWAEQPYVWTIACKLVKCQFSAFSSAICLSKRTPAGNDERYSKRAYHQ